MKKFNIYRYIWVSCLFLLLIVILVMVVDYKVNYEYQMKNNRLYFYDCSGIVCTTEVRDNGKREYSSYECIGGSCPVFKGVINNDYALLKDDSSFTLYNYKNGNVIASGYDSYTFINSNYIIVTRDAKDGVININNNIRVDLEYDQIGYYKDNLLVGYNYNNIIANKSGMYGIISYKDGTIVEEFKYEEKQLEEVLAKININE